LLEREGSVGLGGKFLLRVEAELSGFSLEALSENKEGR
jgi:hypothetical protein